MDNEPVSQENYALKILASSILKLS